MNRSPMISVVMPVYNSDTYLSESIESILSQTFRDFEFIIICDDPTEKTHQIIEEHLKGDNRIKVFYQKKEGLVASLNKGLKLAKGKYIARMDADDISLPIRLEEQVGFMEANSDIGVCGTWLKTIGDGNKVWPSPRFHDDIFAGMLFKPNIHHPTVIIRNDIILNLQEFFNSDFQHAEDMEYWARLAHRGVRFANIEKVLLRYRLHETNVGKIHNEIQKKNSNTIRWMQLMRLGIEPTEEEREIFTDLMNGIILKKWEIEKVSQLITRIHEANNNTRVFPTQALSQELARRWFKLCLHSSRNGLSIWTHYFKNPIFMRLPVFHILFQECRIILYNLTD
jgi:glycosyltransferase involved in cell wall biosynthesis